MVEGKDAEAIEPYRPNILAYLVGKESVVAVVGAGAVPTGPWSYVTGIPNPGADMVGPPPQYLSVAAWAA